MSDRLHAATRKGLFTLARRGRGDWRVAGTAFLGDPVTMVLDDTRDGTLYAALNLGHFGVKLRRSEDRGQTWVECATPSFPVASGADPADAAAAPSVFQVWALAAGGPAEPGVVWAGTIPAALFRTSDRGDTWQLCRSLWERPERQEWFGGGYDQPGLHSILVDPRDARHLTLGISCGGVWDTRDAGETWACRSDGMVAEYMPPERREDPNIQDPHRVARCPAAPDVMWSQHHNGVFRTEDGARRWSRVQNVKPSVFGFAVAIHPRDPQTVWLAPAVKDECRIPVGAALVVARTRDGGRSFDVLRQGLPQEHAYDLVYRHALEVDGSGLRLALGSTTGGLWTSEDGGDSWQAAPGRFPPIYQVSWSGIG